MVLSVSLNGYLSTYKVETRVDRDGQDCLTTAKASYKIIVRAVARTLIKIHGYVVGKKMMAVLLDLYGNEARVLIDAAEFRKHNSKNTRKEKRT